MLVECTLADQVQSEIVKLRKQFPALVEVVQIVVADSILPQLCRMGNTTSALI